MNHLEIILKDVEKEYIEEMFFHDFIFDVKNIISSHFYDTEKNTDIEYQEVKSLNKYFKVPGTGNIYLKKVIIGTELENAFILIACDEKYGDITVNFAENQFEKIPIQEIKMKLESLLSLLRKMSESEKINEIIIGYEPAEDDDMKVIEINQDKIKIYNEGTFGSSVVMILHDIAKKRNT